MNSRYSLKEFMKDMRPVFHFTTERDIYTLPMLEIYDNAIIVTAPPSPFPDNYIKGFLTTTDGTSIVEVSAHITEGLPDHKDPNTVRIEINTMSMKRLNSRLYPRIQFTPPIEGEATIEGHDTPSAVKIVDLSAGGLRFETDMEFPQDRNIAFEFSIDVGNLPHEIKMDGRILIEHSSNGSHMYSLAFSKHGYDSGSFNAELASETARKTIYLVDLVNRLLECQNCN